MDKATRLTIDYFRDKYGLEDTSDSEILMIYGNTVTFSVRRVTLAVDELKDALREAIAGARRAFPSSRVQSRAKKE